MEIDRILDEKRAFFIPKRAHYDYNQGFDKVLHCNTLHYSSCP